MGVSVQYLKYNEKQDTARMRYRDNGVTDSVKWLFNTPTKVKDFEHGEFSQDRSILLADNFLDDVSSMSKQARTELARIQPIIQAQLDKA